MNRRPSFGQWLRSVWLDILTMAILGAIGLGV
jgi:diacylglycerol diphosphate phosphatase/phosphatidate phosphatase